MKRFFYCALTAALFSLAAAAGNYATGEGVIRPAPGVVGVFNLSVFTEVATHGYLKFAQLGVTSTSSHRVYLTEVTNAEWTANSVTFWGWGTFDGRQAWVVCRGIDFQPGPTTVLDQFNLDVYETPQSLNPIFTTQGGLVSGDISVMP
jgi:hypothetical protein